MYLQTPTLITPSFRAAVDHLLEIADNGDCTYGVAREEDSFFISDTVAFDFGRIDWQEDGGIYKVYPATVFAPKP